MTEPFAAAHETIACAESFIDSLPLNGTLIPLGKKIAGKSLSLMARHITSPFTALAEYAPSDQSESFLLLNIFGTDVNGSENVGFIDWAIKNDDATCRNMQMYITPRNKHEELAAEVFGFPFIQDGFMVEKGFYRNGIGIFWQRCLLPHYHALAHQELSLLLATQLRMLNHFGDNLVEKQVQIVHNLSH